MQNLNLAIREMTGEVCDLYWEKNVNEMTFFVLSYCINLQFTSAVTSGRAEWADDPPWLHGLRSFH